MIGISHLLPHGVDAADHLAVDGERSRRRMRAVGVARKSTGTAKAKEAQARHTGGDDETMKVLHVRNSQHSEDAQTFFKVSLQKKNCRGRRAGVIHTQNARTKRYAARTDCL